MPSDPNSVESIENTKAIKFTMAYNAFMDKIQFFLPGKDALASILLVRDGLLSATRNESTASILASILANPSDERRLRAPSGPLVVFRPDETGKVVIEPADYLFDEDIKIRELALGHYLALSADQLSARTRRALESAAEGIRSDDRSQWHGTAESLYRLLEVDFFIQLASLRQCIAVGFSEGVSKYSAKVFRPSLQSLNLLDDNLPLGKNQPQFVSELRAISLKSTTTLSELLDGYMVALGHLPFIGDRGLSSFVAEWSRSSRCRDLWNELWEWVEKQSSPLAVYHACEVFIAMPQEIPAGQEPRFWAELASILTRNQEAIVGTRWEQPWRARNELALHYANLLECLLPWQPGDLLMALAWWLTERVFAALPSDPESLRRFRETTVLPEVEWSRFMVGLGHPRIQTSPLRYLTRFARSTWSLAILCAFADAEPILKRSPPSGDVARTIEREFIALIAEAVPTRRSSDHELVFGYDRLALPAVESYCSYVPDLSEEYRKPLENACEIGKKPEAGAPCTDLLELVAQNEDRSLHLAAAHSLVILAYNNPESARDVIAWLGESGRFKHLLSGKEKIVATLILEALAEFQTKAQDGLLYSLSSQLGTLAEQSTANLDEAQLLFSFTLFSSIQSDSVVALESLLRGEHKQVFAPFAREWRQILKSTAPSLPPWVAGRVRGVLASLTL